MHGNITPMKPEKPIEPVVKHCVIPLTNRAPIRVAEDTWPVIAEGVCGYTEDGAPCGWEISIRVRDEKANYNGHTLIYAEYHIFDEDTHDRYADDDKKNQRVRVGRVLSQREVMGYLWKHILAVGEELRARIINERMRDYVTMALDRCFASLPPHENG